MRRVAGLSIAAAVVASTAPASTPEDGARLCAEGLQRSLTVMEGRPLLKEELATGLMWLRLDAQLALEAGDVDTCMEKLAAVETILGLEGTEDD